MPSLKQLRQRLRTVNNTKMITRAMRSVAASKMRKTQDRRTQARPYVERLQALVAQVLNNVGSENQPLMEDRPVRKRLLVVFSSDRGLCGAFNATINRFALQTYEEKADKTDFYIIGRRAVSFFKKREATIHRQYSDFMGNIDVPRIFEIAKDLQQLFTSGEYDQIELLYNHAITAMVYRPKREQLLPLDPKQLEDEILRDSEEKHIDYIFEPDPQWLLAGLLPKFVETKVFFTFIEAFAAEHQARRIAMSNANENCEEMLHDLTLELNKARQAMITKELLEIVGGAEALRG
jgi:F-type H+-transporting ATPase subunit gamma